MPRVRVSAKTDYALRAALVLARAEGGQPVKAERIAAAQEIPVRFLENILGELRHAGLVESRRGAEGGYLLAAAADTIALADVVRAVDGPLANVGGRRPDALEYPEGAEPLREVWVAVRAGLREVLERTSLADVASGELPSAVAAKIEPEDAWQPR
jgi:Rrf2 family protein